MNDPLANQTAATLAAELERLVSDQLRRVRGRWLVHGLATTLLLPLVVVAGAFLLDHTLRLPLPIRLFHTLLAVLACAMAARRWVLYPLRRSLLATDVAMLLERAFPDLHERLVTSIQLKGALDAASADALRNQSPAMIDQLLRETTAQARALPLERLFDPRRTLQLWSGAAAMALLLLTGAWSAPEHALAFVLRHLGRDVSYPRATTLVVELPPAGPELQRQDAEGRSDLVVPAGADLHVSVLAQGTVPDEVFLDLAAQSGDRRSIAMAPRPGDRFRHVFRRVNHDFEFRARGGDDDRGDRLVAVRTVRPPLVAQIKAELRPPAYTRLPATMQAGGAIEALIGTTVTLAVATTGSSQTATLVFLESGKRVPMQLETATDDAGTAEALACTFVIEGSDRYQIRLTGEGGLENPDPGTYPLSALQDYAPVGRWLLPDDEASTALLPEALLCVRGDARDDFGLQTGTLAIDAGAGRTLQRALLTAPTDAAAPVLAHHFLELIELEDLLGSQRSADGLSLQIDLTDNRAPEANSTQLPRRQVQIVDQQGLAAAIARHFRGLREEAEQAFDLQTDRQARLQELLAQSPTPGAATGQTLTAIEVGQGRVQSAAERLLRGTMRAFDWHLWNRLDPSPAAATVVELYRDYHRQHQDAAAFQPAFYRHLAERRRDGSLPAMEQALDPILQMIVLCLRLHEEQTPPALRLLAEAQVATTSADLQRHLHAVEQTQTAIAALLQDLLLRLDEWNDYQDLIQEARALGERQRDLQHRTEELRGRK